jgi:hypothetical protein
MVDITFDEFFELRKLLDSSEEDYNVGVSNLKNLKFNDDKIVDLLFIKALRLDKRSRFLERKDAVDHEKNASFLLGRSIYKNIVETTDKKVYVKILTEIMINY